MSLVAQALLLSWIPGVFWLTYVESRSPRSSGWSSLAVAFVAGAGSVMGVSLFHRVVEVQEPADPLSLLFYLCWAVGLVEELCKMLAVLLVAWPRRSFREPWDGMSTASAAALGFATAENFTYVLNYGDAGVLLGRSLTATLAHVTMSSLWGYALGLARYRGGLVAGSGLVLEALVWAAVFHGFYDWFLMINLAPAALLVFVALFGIFRQRLQESFFASSRRSVAGQKVRECQICRALGRQEYVYCPACGKSDWSSRVFCLTCLKEVSGEAESCSACQKPFL